MVQYDYIYTDVNWVRLGENSVDTAHPSFVHKAFGKVKIMAPPTACLSPVGEPALLKGRRYGNLVLVITKPVPEHVAGARATEAAATVDLESAALGRRLRTLAVPAHIQSGRDARAFAGSAAVLRDEPASSEPA